MAKEAQFFGAERADLVDVNHATSTYPRGLRDEILRFMIGAGILDGFRIAVPDQSGPFKGQVDIYNGRAVDWGGGLLNDQTGTLSERIPLQAINTEFWLEIRILFVDGDFDSRAFWDALVANTASTPPGQEVQVARTATRRVPAWEVVQPIRQNAVGLRTDGSYNPARFSDSDELIIPVGVIRTNASGQILAGNPETDASGNDIVTVPFQGGSLNVIRPIGYGESGTCPVTIGALNNVPWSRKASDQRPRVFESLAFPFGYGNTGELVGDEEADHWVRDLKSAYDALTSQFKRLIYGVDTETIFTAGLQAIDPQLRYVDVVGLIINNGTSFDQNAAIPVDMFMGWTFQITGSGWGGFYAQVYGNDRMDGSNVVRLYLHRHSLPPEWWPLPDTSGVGIRLVRSRGQNWAARPLPSSNFRGVNALDTEVVNARTDFHSTVVFDSLKERLDAGKAHEVVVSPNTTTTARLADIIIDSTDPTSIANARTLIDLFLSGSPFGRGGSIHFRKGTYTLDNLLDPSLNSNVFISDSFLASTLFLGDGPDRTRLNFGETIGTADDLTLFSLSASSDLEFRNLRFSGKGTIFRLSGCSNIRFINCYFEGNFTDLTRGTLELGSGFDFYFEGCTFAVSGLGVRMETAQRFKFSRCRFFNFTGLNNQCNYLMSIGASAKVEVKDCEFAGAVGEAAIICNSDISRSIFNDNDFSGVTGPTTANAVIECRSGVLRCKIHNNTIGTQAASNGIPVGIKVDGALSDSSVAHNAVLGFNVGMDMGAPNRSSVHDNHVLGNGNVADSIGIKAATSDGTQFHHNHVQGYEWGMELVGCDRCSVDNNSLNDVLNGINLGESDQLLAQRPRRTSVTGNKVVSSGATSGNIGIQAFAAQACTFTGNINEDLNIGMLVGEVVGITPFANKITGNLSRQCDIGFFLERLTDSIVTGNQAYDTRLSGFRMDDGTTVTMHGNLVTAAAGFSPSDYTGLSDFMQRSFGIGNAGSVATYADLRFYPIQQVTTVERDAIVLAGIQPGLVVFNTTTSKHQGWDGANWQDLY